jgi:putative hemolysin
LRNKVDQLEGNDVPADARHTGLARHDGRPPVLGRIGSLETRLARNQAEIGQAQALRHAVFGQARQSRAGEAAILPTAQGCANGSNPSETFGDPVGGSPFRDADAWDRVCDHLLVIDRQDGAERIVGTYRLLTARNAKRYGMPLYTAQEFDIEPLMARHRHLEFMELGRSCVLPQWRTKRTMELMWHGVWAHVLDNGVDVLTGCASFPGTDAGDFAEPLSFLHHFAAPLKGWDVRARNGVTTNLMPAETINTKRALHALPPLIKGYLRLGARFAAEAAIDPDFGTTDVLVILPVAAINPRYVQHYGADAGRYSI